MHWIHRTAITSLIVAVTTLFSSGETWAQKWPPVEVRPVMDNWQASEEFLKHLSPRARLDALLKLGPAEEAAKAYRSLGIVTFIVTMGHAASGQADESEKLRILNETLDSVVLSKGGSLTELAALTDSDEKVKKMIESHSTRMGIESVEIQEFTLNHPEFSRWVKGAVKWQQNVRATQHPDSDVILNVLVHASNEFERRAGRYPRNLSELETQPTDLSDDKWAGPYAVVGKDWWGSEFRLLQIDEDRVCAGSAGRDGKWKSADDLYWPSDYIVNQDAEGKELQLNGLYQTCDMSTKMARSYKYLKFDRDGRVTWINTPQLENPANHEKDIYCRLSTPSLDNQGRRAAEIAPEYVGGDYDLEVGRYKQDNGIVVIEFKNDRLALKVLGATLEVKDTPGDRSRFSGTRSFTYTHKRQTVKN